MSDVASLPRSNPIVRLEEKYKAWIIQQPEWLEIVALPRQQRRAALKELASRLYTIPVMETGGDVPRVQRRKVKRALAHATRTGQLTEEVREAIVKATEQEAEEVAKGVLLDTGEAVTIEEAEALPDPEGDVKAQIEEAKEAATGDV